MNGEMTCKAIARIHAPFPGKFGIPRQSGRVPQIVSRIVFEPEFRNPDALRGLEGFSHLWLIWQFSEVDCRGWSPTVRPPRLGGNVRMGVFATRSPYRPNPLGLSCVKLLKVVPSSPEGPYLEVSGGDLMDNTPIFDIKPYLPGVDSIPDAEGGFATSVHSYSLSVQDPKGLFSTVSAETAELISAVLAEDPRPAYQNDPDREYTFECADHRIVFRVEGSTLILCALQSLT